MSSSSSDAEEDARLRAAAVTVSDIFAKKGATKTPRSDDAQQDHSRDSRYELDPECKMYLASKLDDILEKTYKFTTKKIGRAEDSQFIQEDSGIRLFSNSQLMTDVPSTTADSGQAEKRRKKKDIIARQSATRDMLESCAVSADWLLNRNPLRKT